MAEFSSEDDSNQTNFQELENDVNLHKQLCGMLDRVPLLQQFEHDEIEHLAEHCSAYKVASGVTIFTEGDKSNYMCLVVEGYVVLMKGKKQLATVREGRTMGEMSMLDGLPYSATAISAVDAKFILISRNQLEHLEKKYPQVAVKLLHAIGKLMSIRLRETTNLLLDRL